MNLINYSDAEVVAKPPNFESGLVAVTLATILLWSNPPFAAPR